MELYSDPSNHMEFNGGGEGDMPLENYATVSLLHQLKAEVIEMFRSEMKSALTDFTASAGLEGMKADITKLNGDLVKETDSRTDYDTRSTLSIEKIIEELVQIHLKVMKVEEDIGKVNKKCKVQRPPAPVAPVEVPGLENLLAKVEVMSEEMMNQFREIKEAQLKIQEEMEAVKGDLEGLKEEMRRMKEENERREVASAPAPVEAAMEVEEVQDNQVDTRSDPEIENKVDTSRKESQIKKITIFVGQDKPASTSAQVRDLLNPRPGPSKLTTRRQSAPKLIPLLNTSNDSKNDDVQLLTVHGRDISNTSEFECFCGEKFKMLGNLFAHIQKFASSSSNPIPRRAKRTGVSLSPTKPISSKSSVATVPVTVDIKEDEDVTPSKVSRPGRYSMVKCRCGCGQLFNSESDDHLGSRSEPEAPTEKAEAVSDILLSSMAKKIRQKLKTVTTKVREQREAQARSESSTVSNGSEGKEGSTTAETDGIEELD